MQRSQAFLWKRQYLGIPSRKPDGSPNPLWKIIVSVMASVYELERDIIAEHI
ncbi:MAG: hypothetical protein OXC92_03525 [Flavobacteriaceae bacterium]|nr:hypothetical protein [Flavobacteriaceae bacterium]